MKLQPALQICTILLCAAQLKYIESSGFGKCPNYPSMPKFNMTKFLGKWYEVERSFYLPEIASGCTTLTFENTTIRDIDGRPQLEIAIKTVNRWTGNPSVSIGDAITENEKSSIMSVQLKTRLPSALAKLLPGSGKYQILYTNYNDFAILWSCSSFVAVYADQIWLLGRERDYSADTRKKIYSALTQLSLDPERLFISKNNGCPNTL
ncbi:apolipoprotein D-like [Wyeomyia smithii]|uniref:apolipoprotein D-like n=1 Tax=Wyeomyia smithii TaxID=174621 RepID=UPI002467F0E0|nr:apolipoprotein D-like [Wyeomyia smithii]XP_055537266.1 apolipoprotein D-like [Wyeomyia smithii]XP_055537267.1 apolipoprotein D-like [Wyeomyia smithii]XP_055537268.1 apolipoprotein D-like [Wyeomyia smithii]